MASEAIGLFRRLAASTPSAFNSRLANALDTYATLLERHGRHLDSAASRREIGELGDLANR